MDSLQINTSEKHIPIIRDGSSVGELVFNPNDAIFRERFYKLAGEFQEKLNEYQSRANELEKNKDADENDIPVNSLAKNELAKEGCVYMRKQIDYLFGTGTSQLVFGDVMELDLFPQFFAGVTPLIAQTASEKVQKYTNARPKKRVKK